MRLLIPGNLASAIAATGLCLVTAGCSTANAASSPIVSQATSDTTPVAASATDPSTSIQLVIDPTTSQASYHAHEQLVGHALPSEAVGTTRAVSGILVLNPDGTPAADQSQFTIDLTSLRSDESRRDNFIQGNTLQTSQYPTATFVATQLQGLPSPLPTSGQATFQLVGDLTVHGVTQPAVWQVTANFDGSTVTGDATTTVQLTDFGMAPPKAGPVLTIDNAVTLELAFGATRQA